MSFREPNGVVIKNMKPQRGRSIAGPSLRGLWGRSATGQNGQAAANKEVSAVWSGAGCPKIIWRSPAGRSVFLLTSLFIGLTGRVVSEVHGLHCRTTMRYAKISFTLSRASGCVTTRDAALCSRHLPTILFPACDGACDRQLLRRLNANVEDGVLLSARRGAQLSGALRIKESQAAA